jgi:hypothetical protein
MSGFEFGNQSCYLFAPRKSTVPVIIDQTLGRLTQSGDLVGFHRRTAGDNRGQIYSGQAAMRPFYFKIFRGLIVIRRISFFAG